MPCDATSLIAAAVANGYDGLGDRELRMAILEAACEGGAGGGGGTATGGAVGVVDPEGVVTAPAGSSYYNTANQTYWVKGSGAGNTGWVSLI